VVVALLLDIGIWHPGDSEVEAILKRGGGRVRVRPKLAFL